MLSTKSILLWQGIGAVALALAVLTWFAYDAFQVLSSRQESNVTLGSNPGVSGSGELDQRYDVSKIIDAHIFGQVRKAEAARPRESAPETKLQLRLRGLIASANERLARAVIDVNGSNAKTYSVGQTIENTDAAIHAVESNKVLLERGGALESLVLKRQELGSIDTRSLAPADAKGAANEPVEARPAEADSRVREQLQNNEMKIPF